MTLCVWISGAASTALPVPKLSWLSPPLDEPAVIASRQARGFCRGLDRRQCHPARGTVAVLNLLKAPPTMRLRESFWRILALPGSARRRNAQSKTAPGSPSPCGHWLSARWLRGGKVKRSFGRKLGDSGFSARTSAGCGWNAHRLFFRLVVRHLQACPDFNPSKAMAFL